MTSYGENSNQGVGGDTPRTEAVLKAIVTLSLTVTLLLWWVVREEEPPDTNPRTGSGADAYRKAHGYLTGEAGRRDWLLARDYAKASAQSDDPRGKWIYAGLLYMVGQTNQGSALIAAAKPELRRMAEQGDPYALCMVSSGFFSKDLRGEKAMETLRRSAKSGFAQAQQWLASRLTSRFRAPDAEREAWEEAIHWLTQAAKQGHVEGARNLAECYMEGRGVPMDLETAWKWHKVAAGHGGHVMRYYYESFSPRWPAVRDHRRAIQLAREGARRHACDYEGLIARLYEEEPIADRSRARVYYERSAVHCDNSGLAWFLIRSEEPDVTRIQTLLRERVERNRVLMRGHNRLLRRVHPSYETGNRSISPSTLLTYVYAVLSDEKDLRADATEANVMKSVANLKRRFPPEPVFPHFVAAYCYATGRGVEKDLETSAEVFARPFVGAPGILGGRIEASDVLGMMPRGRADVAALLLPVCRPLAEKGVGPAQLLLAYVLESVSRPAASGEQVNEWYREAARQGLAEAQVRLALRHLDGSKGSGGFPNAETWLRRVAANKNGGTWAMFGRALQHYHGVGTEVDRAAAAQLLVRANKERSAPAPAVFLLAQMYARGEGGLEKAPTQALRLLERVAWNVPRAAMMAGDMWNRGVGCGRNIYEAADYYHRAFHLSGVPRAGRMLRELRAEYRKRHPSPALDPGKDESGGLPMPPHDAYREFVRAFAVEDFEVMKEMIFHFRAESAADLARDEMSRAGVGPRGASRAQIKIGTMFQVGNGVKASYGKAKEWLLFPARRGDAVAQRKLATLYYQYAGEASDYSEAAKWYRRACEQGDAKACYNLGTLYWHGQGVEKDYAEATGRFRTAAEQGIPEAQLQLGEAYRHGQGVKRDRKEALRWFRRAAQGGNREAREILRRLSGDDAGP